MPREKVLACAVRLLDRGFFRIGSEDYAEENDTYGIATMQKRHVTVRGDQVVFDYESKGGQHRVQSIVDPEVAEIVQALKRRRGGGEEILAYKEGRRWVDVKSADINEYVKEAASAEFSAKDFRTWSGTVLASVALAVSAPAQNGKGSRKRAKTRAIKEVAHHLGNTPAVARASYIDPRVFDRYDGGLTIGGVLPELGDDVEAWPELQREIEEGVLDLIERDTESDAVEKAGELAKELEEVAA
jgi:DNA topoisomerase IB